MRLLLFFGHTISKRQKNELSEKCRNHENGTFVLCLLVANVLCATFQYYSRFFSVQPDSIFGSHVNQCFIPSIMMDNQSVLLAYGKERWRYGQMGLNKNFTQMLFQWMNKWFGTHCRTMFYVESESWNKKTRLQLFHLLSDKSLLCSIIFLVYYLSVALIVLEFLLSFDSYCHLTAIICIVEQKCQNA